MGVQLPNYPNGFITKHSISLSLKFLLLLLFILARYLGTDAMINKIKTKQINSIKSRAFPSMYMIRQNWEARKGITSKKHNKGFYCFIRFFIYIIAIYFLNMLMRAQKKPIFNGINLFSRSL